MRLSRSLVTAVVFGLALFAGPTQVAFGATLTVDSTADTSDFSTADAVCDTDDSVGDGPCTLRAAIEQANFDAGTDTIAFSISGVGPHTISPGSALPIITDPVIIDGYTQPGASANTNPIASGSNAVLKIILDGTSAGAGVDGLSITAGSSTVKGLVINQFGDDGIELATNGSNAIQGNYIGTDAAGSAALGNSSIGVIVFGVPDNTIGGTGPGARNIISGNSTGVAIIESAAMGNSVQGNYIGTDATGTLDLGNSVDGVYITGAPGNTIGGTASGARNVISGNTDAGVIIDGSGATGNKVEGNYIGTDAAGSAALGNLTGVFIVFAPGNTIGGTASGARNVISGNNGFGVVLEGAGNKVEGNYIGTDATGSAALGNFDGVGINAPSNTIGGTASGARNVISGNYEVGIIITFETGNKVEGNYIGTDATGSAALGNTHGVLIDSSSNTIGGTASGARNIISGNNEHAIIIENTATANKVEGNYIGTDVTGTAPLGNTGFGVYILFASSNIIGGTAAGARNVISGNDIGVYIVGGGATGNKVEGNYIGTDAAGSSGLGNISIGVAIENAPSNTVGGPAAGNVISGNGGSGVSILSGEGNTISENSIYSNGGLGIDNDVGGNAELTPPTVTAAGSASGSSDCASCTIEVFSDVDDEGEMFHGTATTAAGPCPCAWSFPGAVTGPNITATVTDGSGNTSEFSAPFFYDTDLDGFTDAIEAFVGTDSTDSCANTATANDEADDRWPADTNDNQFVNTFDVVPYIAALNSTPPGPPYTVRLDLNMSNSINTFDVVPFIQLLNKACLP